MKKVIEKESKRKKRGTIVDGKLRTWHMVSTLRVAK